MSQRSANKRKEWSDKVESWSQSGKSVQAWCREKQINYTLFISWRKRLESNPKNSKHKNTRNTSKRSFIELKEESSPSPGICLEYAGIRIHLSKDFDAALLRRCLSVLQGALC